LPIGAQTEEGRNEALRKHSMFLDEDVVPFHYGSHYSSAGIVLHYLVRLDPFTELAKSLQGGNFDVADRLFY
jgi:Beige/BEACH domain.